MKGMYILRTMDNRYSIKAVSMRTGLSVYAIRAWEKRYNVLTPKRTLTNRRMYSDTDIEKLEYLSRAIANGHSIGNIARLDISELRLLGGDNVSPEKKITNRSPGSPSAEDILVNCIHAIERLDVRTLEEIITHASVFLGVNGFLENVVLPLLRIVGDRWQVGTMRVAHEHLTTAVIRTALGRILETFRPSSSAPSLIATTPSGQMHEMGALLAAVTGASEGWNVHYLGPDMPAEEIAGAAYQCRAEAVILSIIYPPDDPLLTRELERLRALLSPNMIIIAGGMSSSAYRRTLEKKGFVILQYLQDLRKYLVEIRLLPVVSDIQRNEEKHEAGM
jgi:DNA-binding transcriptional MerR regulator/methylmalonyl-CoA mutase cobalamin-binding subunit